MRAPEFTYLHLLGLCPDILRDRASAVQNRDIFEHLLAPIPEAWRPDRDALKSAAELVYCQRGQCLTIEVLGNSQQGLSRGNHLFQQRDEILHHADLLVGDKDRSVFQYRFHLFSIGDEVRRQITVVEGKPLHDLELCLCGLGFFKRDDPSAPTFSNASVTSSPTVESLCAEMAAT